MLLAKEAVLNVGEIYTRLLKQSSTFYLEISTIYTAYVKKMTLSS